MESLTILERGCVVILKPYHGTIPVELGDEPYVVSNVYKSDLFEWFQVNGGTNWINSQLIARILPPGSHVKVDNTECDNGTVDSVIHIPATMLPDPAKLEGLASWLDYISSREWYPLNSDDSYQNDLRKWASVLRDYGVPSKG